MIISPVRLARNSVQTALADPAVGFNTTYTNMLVDYPGAPGMAIDFASLTSQNFFLGDIDPEAIEGSGVFTYPILTLFGTAGAGGGRQATKFQRFSGLVKVGARYLLSSSIYESARLLHDFEVWPDAVENAMLTVINKPTQTIWGQGPGWNVMYGGDISWDRKFLVEGGSGWLQILSFQLVMQVEIT